MSHRCVPFKGLLAGVALIMLSVPSYAAWPHDPFTNVEIYGARNYRNTPRACNDGAGGAFVTWIDFERTPGCHCDIHTDVVMQHVSAEGERIGSGRMLSEGGDTGHPVIVSDGQGGTLVAWHDWGRWSDQPGVFVQRVSHEGIVLWTGGGVRVTADTAQVLSEPVLASDGAGGAIVAWTESRDEYGSTFPRIYSQKLDAGGSTRWSDGGLAACGAAWEMRNPSIASSGDGGAIVAWEDKRADSIQVYAQKLTSSYGGAGWPDDYDHGPEYDGIPIAVDPVIAQSGPQVVADGMGGAFFVWESARDGIINIYAQRVDSYGYVAWPLNGKPVAPYSGDQRSPSVASDGIKGLLVAWEDRREASGVDVFAQRLDAAGRIAWSPTGVSMCGATGDQSRIHVVGDGSGGAIASWSDPRATTLDVWAQRVSADGTVRWGSDGAAISLANGNQFNPDLTDDGRGGAIVVWDDARSDYSREIYGQRIDRSGDLGDPGPIIVAAADVPNDQGGSLKLSWLASYLDTDPSYAISSYWVWRSISEVMATEAIHNGAVLIDGDDAALQSLADAGGRIIEKKFEAGLMTFWEFVTSRPASADSGYSFIVQTTSDSTAEHHEATLFRVQARHRDGTTFWNSAPRAGYSKDNLPPPYPGPLTATVASGSLHLHWQSSSATDFRDYQVFRGTAPDFELSDDNRISTQSDTGYAGPIDYAIYKVVAADLHGNRSAVATLAASTIVGAASPSVLKLSLGISPSPMRSRAQIDFALPVPSYVKLTVFDVAGRVLRVLANETLDAGNHSVIWAGDTRSRANVQDGVYFVCMEAGGRRMVERLVVAN